MQAIVRSSLLWGPQAWTPSRRLFELVDASEVRWLRRMTHDARATGEERILYHRRRLERPPPCHGGGRSALEALCGSIHGWWGHAVRHPESTADAIAHPGTAIHGRDARSAPALKRCNAQQGVATCRLCPCVKPRASERTHTQCNRNRGGVTVVARGVPARRSRVHRSRRGGQANTGREKGCPPFSVTSFRSAGSARCVGRAVVSFPARRGRSWLKHRRV